MWTPILPLLGEKFAVIAPDLPGIGDSDIPANGLDMKTAAIRIHALARSLGVQKARVVGHDIGLMIAVFVGAQHRCAPFRQDPSRSAGPPIKLSSRASAIAAWYSLYSTQAGHSREKTPGTLLPLCPPLLPAEEARADPSVPVGSLGDASP